MKWYILQLAAWIRGKFYRWPSHPDIPPGYTGVSCGLRSWREARDMYPMGWIPWSIQKTWDGAVSRSFIVKANEPAQDWFQDGPPVESEDLEHPNSPSETIFRRGYLMGLHDGRHFKPTDVDHSPERNRWVSCKECGNDFAIPECWSDDGEGWYCTDCVPVDAP